jgi:hypothetical protein
MAGFHAGVGPDAGLGNLLFQLISVFLRLVFRLLRTKKD